jgi:hypothetical protein
MRVKRPRVPKKKSRERSISPGAVGSAVGLGVAALAVAPAANAAVFDVTNLNDSGAGSLRQAIIDANTAAGADVITFQAALTGTITLSTGQLYITDSVDIQGPGPSVITVSGDNSSRVFYMYSSSSTIDVRIAGLTITEGAANIGAGIVDFDENLTLDDVVLTQNNATGDGGGLWADGFNMTLTISNSTLSGNTSGDDGGGIYIEDTGALLTIDDSVITGNQAQGSGGGIYFYDPDHDVLISDTTISGNTSVGGAGGGVYLYSFDNGGMTIERSTISGNSSLIGGGLFLYGIDTAPLVIENTTISGNTATNYDGGGVFLYVIYGTEANLNFVTIANNSGSESGGGLVVLNGTGTVTNSVIADNVVGVADDPDDIGTGPDGTIDLSYTLVEEPGAATINDTAGNIFNQDPQLGALADNGGPTETQRPALTSPVVNAADPAFAPPPATDQRGQTRAYPTAADADMGALELIGGVIQFNPTTESVAENAGMVTLTVVRDIGPDPASVDFTTTPGTATPGVGNDYTTTTTTVNFAAGDLSETVDVPILDDNAAEGNEQFTATLSNPSLDATIGANNVATVTITDFEPGQFVFSSPTYGVGEQGGSVSITVNRVNGSDGPVSVNYTTADGSATQGVGNDYTTTSGTLNWAAGDTTPQSFNVPILDDNALEGNEDFTVSLNTPINGTIGVPGSATVTITDDPAGTLQFSAASTNGTEEAGSVTLTVTRTGGTEGPLSVNYQTNDGTATAPSDYVTEAGMVTFPAGDATPQTIDITLVDDAVNEGSEMFTVTLSGAAAGSPSTATVVLAASDAGGIPTVSWWGKILLTIMSAMAGLWVTMRNRLSVFLVAMLCAGMLAAPTLSAAQKKTTKTPKANAETKSAKEGKGTKFRGTVLAVDNSGNNLVLNLDGGVTFSLPKSASMNISDHRLQRPQPGTTQQLVKGAKVVVKYRTDASGNIKHVKIKIVG